MASVNHWPPEAWLLWAVFAVSSFALDLALPSFYFFFVGVSALVAAILAFWYGWIVQLAAFMLSAVFTVLVVRPKLVAHLRPHPNLPSRITRLVGLKGVVSEALNPVENSGRVTVDGHDWLARAARALPVGAEVLVEGHEGITLLVKEI